MKAFRCKNCGHLHEAGHAGMNPIPSRCVVCKKGVKFTEDGTKTSQPENWEILADMKPEDLMKIGLTASQVERHVPITEEQDHKNNIERINLNLADIAKEEAKGQIDDRTKEQKAELQLGLFKSTTRLAAKASQFTTPKYLERTAQDGIKTQDKVK